MTTRIVRRAALVAAASLAALAPLTGCASEGQTSSPSPSTTALDADSDSPAMGTSSTASISTPSTPTTQYNDGSYTVRGVYGGAPSYMTITLTLSDDVITGVVVEPMPENNDISRGYQEQFAAAVPGEVIGKSIDELEVGIIAGASGCADGFNDALDQIREEAAI